MSRAAPLGPGEAASLLAPFQAAKRILLAVSGGPDSVALMHLARHASSDPWPAVIIATVDHGLQVESGDVARRVVAQARSLGLEAHSLAWVGPKPSTGIQAAARTARYALLDALAADLQATHVVTAHTLDDQAETILFRMARGSGPAGLAGMRASTIRGALTHLRPFLGVPKARLVATCRQAGWPFVEDPANHDPRYARSRIRTLLPGLAAEGLDAATLAVLGKRLDMREEAIATMAESLGRRAAEPAEPDRLAYDAAILFDAPRALAIAVLQRALTDFNHAGLPRLARLEALAEQLDQAFRRGQTVNLTLHGALVRLGADARIEVTREAPRHRGRAAGGYGAEPKP